MNPTYVGPKLMNTGIAVDAVAFTFAKGYEFPMFVVGAILMILGCILIWLDK